jgi:hypothetical protein
MEKDKGYGICYNEWLQDDAIKNELRLLIKISSLTAEKGFCFAGNSYFAEYFKMDITNVSKKIKKLEKLKYLHIEYERRGTEIISRKIRLVNLPTDHWQKHQPTIGENTKDNNIIIPPSDLVVNYIDICLKDTLWIEAFCMTTKTNPYTIEQYLIKFNRHLIQVSKTHPNIKDFKQHFNNWINKQGNIAKMYKPAPTNLRYT